MLERIRLGRRRRGLARELAAAHPPPQQAWEGDYGDRHGKLLQWAHRSQEFQQLLATGEPLPEGYGVGLDERVVEFPWLYTHRPFGRLLDAGSTLNHEQVLDRFQPQTSWLCIATLHPEQAAYTQRGVSYVYCDLRDLPFRDACFDSVICASTIEHVGMDNRRYGDSAAVAGDPGPEQRAALDELLRVVEPGGQVLLTIPYGRAEDHGWFRQYDDEALRELIRGHDASVRVYGYGASGWQVSDHVTAASAAYKDHSVDRTPAPDRAAAARAVACIRIRRPDSASS